MTRLLLTAALVAMLVAGCYNSSSSVAVRNAADVPLSLSVIWADGSEHTLGSDLAPGERRWLFTGAVLNDGTVGTDGCTVGDLIAYGPDGAEIARHAPPLCLDGKRGPDLWVVERPDPSS